MAMMAKQATTIVAIQNKIVAMALNIPQHYA